MKFVETKKVSSGSRCKAHVMVKYRDNEETRIIMCADIEEALMVTLKTVTSPCVKRVDKVEVIGKDGHLIFFKKF